MKWKRIYSPNELHKGIVVAFSTIQDEKVSELWNEQFTVENVIPNTNGNIELWLNTKEGEKLVVLWEEIDKLWIPAI